MKQKQRGKLATLFFLRVFPRRGGPSAYIGAKLCGVAAVPAVNQADRRKNVARTIYAQRGDRRPRVAETFGKQFGYDVVGSRIWLIKDLVT